MKTVLLVGAVVCTAAAVLVSAKAASADPPFAENPRNRTDPIVPSLCSKVTINPFAVPTSSVNAILPDAVNIGAGSNQGCVTPQNEPAIAINPTNPSNIVVGMNDYRLCCVDDGEGRLRNDGGGFASVSLDGGKTWRSVILPGLTKLSGGKGPFAFTSSAGDPSLSFDSNGVLYYANMEFSRTNPMSLVSVSKSKDGGLTWSRPHIVAGVYNKSQFLDKPWLAVGPRGIVYVTFTVFLADAFGNYAGSPIALATSKNLKKWSLSVVSDMDHPFNQGSVPQVDPSGRLYVAFESADPKTAWMSDVQVIARHGAGGFTLRQVANVWDSLGCYPANIDERYHLTGENFRTNSLPTFAIDSLTGRQILAWADNPSCNSKLTKNTIGVVVGDGNGKYGHRFDLPGNTDAFFPAAAAGNGRFVVGYYTRDYATDGVSADYVFRSSDDWRGETRLTEQSSNPWLQFDGEFIGDYTAAAIGPDGLAHFAWTDFRGAPGSTLPNQDIYVGAEEPPFPR